MKRYDGLLMDETVTSRRRQRCLRVESQTPTHSLDAAASSSVERIASSGSACGLDIVVVSYAVRRRGVCQVRTTL